jgi:dihydropteroate synthase
VSRRRFTLRLPGGAPLALGERTLVMGIVNVTPDSFSDGGRMFDPKAAIAAALRMVDEGADLLDIGGESTRPGALPVDGGEELRRVLPVIEGLAGRTKVPISIDTYKAPVADAALAAGASIVNDISGLRYDPELAGVAARRGAPIILMHTRGRSRDMYEQAHYHDVVDEVLDELRESLAFAAGAGVPREQMLVDPGLGFAKDATHSFELLGRLAEFAISAARSSSARRGSRFSTARSSRPRSPPTVSGPPRRPSPPRLSPACTWCACMRCARWRRWSAWPTRFRSIIANGDGLAGTGASASAHRVGGRAGHRHRRGGRLRGARAHQGHARDADRPQRRLHHRPLLHCRSGSASRRSTA